MNRSRVLSFAFLVLLLARTAAGVQGSQAALAPQVADGSGSLDRPAPKLVVPCEVVSVHDGDTLTVEVRIRVNVRLLECWAPELKQEGGPEARDRLAELVQDKPGVLEIPLAGTRTLGDAMTFGRLLGRLWIDGRDVSAVMVESGMAERERPQKVAQ